MEKELGIIDCWTNVFTPEALHRMYIETEELFQIVNWWGMHEKVKGHKVDDFISILDEAGIEKVLIPAFRMQSFQTKQMLWDFDNKEIYNLVQMQPDRFVGLAGINPILKMDGVRELEMAVKEYGFKGAHLHANGFGIPLNHKDLYPFYAKCVELDIPVMIQTGHSAERMPSEMARPIHLDEVALYFPELRIVAAHTGWPWVEELIALAWKHPNLYIATTAHAPKYWSESLNHFINSRGRGKVMFGTDFPVLKHKESLEQIYEKNYREASLKALLRDVAVKVFKLD
ncbi:amidohydrolase family protein [Bacillus sp. 1P02SD]|uniref:amidohydrolase family protein n=1 Tax=Bacillus sp. 1P02SD TaxID=3132264 RepID=UPI0039A334AF